MKLIFFWLLFYHKVIYLTQVMKWNTQLDIHSEDYLSRQYYVTDIFLMDKGSNCFIDLFLFRVIPTVFFNKLNPSESYLLLLY